MKTKIYFLFFVLILNLGQILAQPPIQWQKSFGGTDLEDGRTVHATNDGGCIIVGYSGSFDGDVTGNHGGQDGWIVKLDMNGDIEWERTLGGSGYDYLTAVNLTPDGGYIVLGTTQSDDGDVSGFHGGLFGDMVWVIKLDSMGNIEWNNCYGGTGNEFAADNIVLTSDGGYLFASVTTSSDGDVTGFHPSSSPFGFEGDIWVVKINSTGILQWQKCLGGSKNESAYDVLETPDNGYMVLGSTWGSYDGDVIGNTDTISGTNSGLESVWIVKLDSARNIIWQKTYGGTGLDYPCSRFTYQDNNYTFLCVTHSEDGDVTGAHGDGPDFWLVNIDSSGAIQWETCFGGDSCLMNGGGLVRTAGGGYAIGGTILGQDSDIPGYHLDPLNTISGDYVFIEADSLGNLEYQHCYGGFLNDAGSDICMTSDNGFIVVGSSSSNDGDVSGHHGQLNSDDMWVIKFSALTTNVAPQVKPLHIFKVYPNPVSTNAKIAFYLPLANKVAVKIFDLAGKEVKTLMNENLNSGYQEVNWDCTNNAKQEISNGIYFVRISAGEYTQTTKLIVYKYN